MKLKKQHLRIDNLLQFETTLFQIKSVKIGWWDIKSISEDPGYFNKQHSPIPLTDHWLLRLGFKMEASGGWTQDWFSNGLTIYLEDKTCTLGDSETTTLEYPEHVHQLQNLYFGLTGEELKS